MMYETKLMLALMLYVSTFIISFNFGKKLGKIRNRAYFDHWFYIGVFEERDRVEGKKQDGDL